jgi:hypothetical protein
MRLFKLAASSHQHIFSLLSFSRFSISFLLALPLFAARRCAFSLFRLRPALRQMVQPAKGKTDKESEMFPADGLIYADNSRTSVQGECQTGRTEANWSYRFCR